MGIFCKRPGLGQQIQRPKNLRIILCLHFQPFLLAKFKDEQLALDVRLDPVLRTQKIGFAEGYLLIIEEVAELLNDNVIYLEILGYVFPGQIVFGGVKEDVALQQDMLKWSGRMRLDLYILSY